MHALLADPWVAAEVDRAVAPYAERLDAEALAFMREQLAEVLVHDREVAAALEGARPRHVDASGEVATVADAGRARGAG